jgi:hypothetical protein
LKPWSIPITSGELPRFRGCQRKEVVIMRLVLETSKTAFTVTKAAEPKTEFGSGQQKMNRASKLPEWTVEVLAMDSERGEVIRVTVTGDQPKVSQGQPVTFSELEAIPWANNGRNGVAYRAAAIHPAAQNRAA